ncbi:MAG: glycerol-3-phosphate dehydrogenase (NAD(P)+) [Rhodothermales bacterium]|jgi:glycerol-3-phosphate dehydrogenase (NAD(P)+)
MKISVMSDGGWGTAIALVLASNGHTVTMWGPFEDYIEEMRETRINRQFLAGIPLPDTLRLTADMGEAVAGAEIMVLAAPTQFARGMIEKIAVANPSDDQIIVSVAKGIEIGSLLRISQICHELLPKRLPYAVLSGPSHAEEVAQRIPTAVVVASKGAEIANRVQDAFMNNRFRVYTSDDVVGVELAGALKNVFAIAAGICDGMAFGDNTKAALITRGIAEMARLGQMLGGRPETFSGLSGVGDMIVTCTSGHSRNRHVGEQLGKGLALDDVIASMGRSVAEGVSTTRSAYELARENAVETPIIREIYAGLYQGKDPREGVRDLMTRAARCERETDF